MSKQLLRCGTSIGANVAESEHSQSKADFITKLYISLKEANETKYWLTLLSRAQYLTDIEYESLMKIPAGEVLGQIGIILLRDPSLGSEKVRLRVRLKANGDFELGESKYLERTITFSDMLEQPSNWASRYMNSYYGTYSKAKH